MYVDIRRVAPLAALVLGVLAGGCDSQGPGEPAEPRFEIVAPTIVGRDGVLPMVILRRGLADTVDVAYSGSLRISEVAGAFAPATVHVRHGVAGHTTRVDQGGPVLVQLAGDAGVHEAVYDGDRPAVKVGGMLPAAETAWSEGTDVLVTSDLILPVGGRLRVGPGARVLLESGVNVFIRGTLDVEGTRKAPVVFSSAESSAPWGGLVIDRGLLTARYAFFINGGGDQARIFGHSESQPVIMFEDAEGYLQYVFVMDSPGKGLGGRRSRIRFDRGLITRTDTGGEVAWGVTHISNSHILEIPNADGVFVDDDNDGFYFYEAHPDYDEPSRVESTYIIVGKDDAIDHNHARLEIISSWLEGFMHECVAGSSGNWVRVYNSVIKGCEQGIEAGYGAPQVFVDHSVVVGNEVGLRYGDSYSNPLEGHMTVTNSIVFGNEDELLNLDRSIGGPASDVFIISNTLIDDPDVTVCSGCVAGTPAFDERYFLLPGSVGIGAAGDGSNLGLRESGWR